MGCPMTGTRWGNVDGLFHVRHNGFVDLNEVVIFTRVVEAESFTVAARRLEMPKSTVSRKVSQLEDRLGVRLLHRTTRSLRLTDVGAAYYERCARIVAQLEEADFAATEAQASPRGTLRVTAPVEFTFLGELVAELLHIHVDLRIEVVLTGRRVDLVEEGFDLAIRAGRLVDSTLIARKLGSVQPQVLAAPAYLAGHARPLEPDDLRTNHECILFGEAQRGGMWQLGHEVQVKGRLVTNAIGLAREAAVAGLGLALLPDFLCRAQLADGRLEAVLDDHLSPRMHVYALYPTSRHLSPKVRTFLDFAVEHLNLS